MDKSETYQDDRGEIATIVKDARIDSVLYITSRAGSRRANHYHTQSGHYCMLVKGEMVYYERPVGATCGPRIRRVKPGELLWTPPMREHLMIFSDDTEFWCFSTGSRAQENYEDDLVRLPYPLDEVGGEVALLD